MSWNIEQSFSYCHFLICHICMVYIRAVHHIQELFKDYVNPILLFKVCNTYFCLDLYNTLLNISSSLQTERKTPSFYSHTQTLCANSLWFLPLCPFTWLLYFFSVSSSSSFFLFLFFSFFPLPWAQFTCYHSNQDSTLLTWAGCHRLSHTEGGAARPKQSSAQCVLCTVVADSNDDKCLTEDLTLQVLYRPSALIRWHSRKTKPFKHLYFRIYFESDYYHF